MSNRVKRLAHGLVLLFSAVFSFFVLFSYEAYGPIGPSWHLTTASTGQLTSSFEEVNAQTKQFAEAESISVVRQAPDISQPRTKAHLYVLNAPQGGFADSWLKSGYRTFNTGHAYQVHDWPDAAQADPRGEYFLSGNRAQIERLEAKFAELGMATSGTQRIAGPSLLGGLLSGASMWLAPLAVAVLIVTLSTIGTIFNNRAYAIQRLNGLSRGAAIRLDAQAAGRFLTRAFALVGLVCTIGLFVINRAAHFGWWLLLWLLCCLLLEMLICLAHLFAVQMLWQTPLISAIKGFSPTRLVFAGAYLVRVAVLVVLFSVAALVMTDGLAASKAQQRFKLWESAPQLGLMTIGVQMAQDGGLDMNAAERVLGPWLHDLDDRGLLMVALANPGSHNGAPGLALDDGRQINVIYVNRNFLQKQPLDSCGSADWLPGDQVTTLIPQQYLGSQEAIVSRVQNWISFGGNRPDLPTAPSPAVREICDGQAVFPYAFPQMAQSSAPDLKLQDPVVVYLPAGTMWDPVLVGAATRGEVLAADAQLVAAEVKNDPAVRPFVLGISPASSESAAELAKAYTLLGASLLNLVMCLAALFAITLGLAFVSARRRGQFIFAARISGWTYGQLFGRFLLIDALICSCIAAAGAAAVLALMRSLYAAGPGAAVLPSWFAMAIPIASLIVIGLSVITLLTGLVWNSKRIVSAGSAEG